MDKGKDIEAIGDGSVEGPISESRKKMLKEMEASNKKVGDDIAKRASEAKKLEDESNKPRNLTDEEKQAAKEKEMDRKMRKAAKKHGMKAGGKVKTKGYAKGGKVRGAGIAKKGVRPCKMR